MASSRHTVIPRASRPLAKAINSRSSVGVTRRWSSGYPWYPPAWTFSAGPLRHAVFTKALARTRLGQRAASARTHSRRVASAA